MHLQYGSMRLDTVRVCQDLSFDTFPTNRDGCVMHELGVTTGSTVDNPVLQSQMEVYRDSMGFRDFWLNMYIYIIVLLVTISCIFPLLGVYQGTL